MSSVRVDRTIRSAPASVALLLADPAVVGLWPGAQAAAGSAAVGLLRLEVDGLRGELRLPPASRTPTAYVLGFDFDGPGHRVVGRLCLATAPGDESITEAILEITGDHDLSGPATTFLERVAQAAQERSRAA